MRATQASLREVFALKGPQHGRNASAQNSTLWGSVNFSRATPFPQAPRPTVRAMRRKSVVMAWLRFHRRLGPHPKLAARR